MPLRSVLMLGDSAFESPRGVWFLLNFRQDFLKGLLKLNSGFLSMSEMDGMRTYDCRINSNDPGIDCAKQIVRDICQN